MNACGVTGTLEKGNNSENWCIGLTSETGQLMKIRGNDGTYKARKEDVYLVKRPG